VAIDFNNRPLCTICGTQKQQTNHWWLIVLGCMGGEIHIVAWDDNFARIADGCACGEACAHKALSRWFTTQTLDAPAVSSEPGTTQGEN
jgi:hypothetical protein